MGESEPELVASLGSLYSRTLALMSEGAVAVLRSTGELAGPQYLRILGALVQSWEANGVVLDAIQAQVVLDSLLTVLIGMSAPKGTDIELFQRGFQAGFTAGSERS